MPPATTIFGCELYVNPSVSRVLSLGTFLVPPDGTWSSSLSLPVSPVLIGLPLLLQSAFIGPAQVTMSNGVVMFLGS